MAKTSSLCGRDGDEHQGNSFKSIGPQTKFSDDSAVMPIIHDNAKMQMFSRCCEHTDTPVLVLFQVKMFVRLILSCSIDMQHVDIVITIHFQSIVQP